MRVGVDARALAGSRGVTRYTGALLEALAREFPDDEWLLFVPGRGEVSSLAGLESTPNVSVRRHPLAGRLLFGAAALARRPRLDRLTGGSPDVVWAPAIAPLALSPGVPLVLTVHDLSFESRPRDFTPYERLWHALARPRSLARRARRVIVPAEATREELVARWDLPAARVRVIDEGVQVPSGPVDLEPTLGRLGLAPDRYLLAVGALEPRKAPLLLAAAYGRARQHGLAADLVFAGEGRLAGGLKGSGVKALGGVSDSELDALYSGAIALVTPSWLEGYGLPVREALARGTPAVVSDLPVYGPELSRALLRVPAGDEEALARALVRIATEPGLRETMALACAPAVAGLTWAAAARLTRSVLAEVCAAGGS